MYNIQPDNTWATRHRIEKNGTPIGQIRTTGWSGNYVIDLGDELISLKNRKWYSSDMYIYRGDVTIGTATNISFSFKPEIQIEYNDRLFRIKSTDMWSKEYEMLLDHGNDSKVIGKVSRTGTFKVGYIIELPEFVEDWFAGVIAAMIIKKANSNAAASAS
jgi:hypothetical protein